MPSPVPIEKLRLSRGFGRHMRESYRHCDTFIENSMYARCMSSSLSRDRESLAQRVRQLRLERRWTQAMLASRLGLSQNRLSEIERGDGSFTAEQFLELLRVFNATVDDFVPVVRGGDAALQKTLARLGATHLRESDDVLVSAQLEQVEEVMREVLLAPASARLVTALAPVLVRQLEQVKLNRLQAWLADHGVRTRLPWLVDNTLAAMALDTSAPKSSLRLYRRAELVLGAFLELHAHTVQAAADLLDPAVRSRQTVAELVDRASEPSRRWSVVTSLQVQDFVSALEAARHHD